MTVKYLIKISIIILILILIIALFDIFIGIVHHSDYSASFHFSGLILETNTNKPIKDVKIYFSDKGFDNYLPSNDPRRIRMLGISENDGSFNLLFDFGWGQKSYIFRPKPKETFDLIFKKAGFEEKIISYDSKKLNRTDIITEVEVGEISLIPIKR